MSLTQRKPKSCPPGWLGRYRVATGDTLTSIARFFRRPASELHKANPHIKNPNQLVPGDILCVSGQLPFPCVVLLEPIEPVPTGTESSALVHIAPQGGQAITFAAVLPPPRHWGRFDSYLAEVVVGRATGSFSSHLFQSPTGQASWVGSIALPTVVSLAPNSRVRIRPTELSTGASGPAILQAKLGNCLHPELCAGKGNRPARKTKKRRKRERQLQRRSR